MFYCPLVKSQYADAFLMPEHFAHTAFIKIFFKETKGFYCALDAVVLLVHFAYTLM